MRKVIIIGRRRMKRTPWVICTGTKNGYNVYRRVMADGDNYYIKEGGATYNVTEDRINFHLMQAGSL